jgi:ARG and Rhodanese-Phosphatase-superfamily-associated Protein domain
MDTITAFTIGEPQVAGPLAVFPVFGPRARFAYRSFAGAQRLGAFVKELDEGAAVRELIVDNPTDLPLLVYEGEEVLGAQQNRTFDVSILVAAGARVRAPVSCVEQGRWDHTRAGDHLAPAPQAADPGLRRAKRVRANERAAAGLAAQADQGEVWHAVATRLADHGVHSPSAAMHDLYKGRRQDLDELTREIRPIEGQVGAVATVGGLPVALDLVSRPDVFADLLPRLAQGYALDALGAKEADPYALQAEAFLYAALYAPRAGLPTPGLGGGLRLVAPGIVGSGLEHDGELIQLCAFQSDEPPLTYGPAAPIARPSRRRRIR